MQSNESILPASLRNLSPQEKLATVARLKASQRRTLTAEEIAELRRQKRALAQAMLKKLVKKKREKKLLTQGIAEAEAIEELVSLGVDREDLQPVSP